MHFDQPIASRLVRGPLAVVAVACLAALGGCTYDFDAPFEGASVGAAGSSATGGAGGVDAASGGAGGSVGGSSGVGGSADAGLEDCFDGVDNDEDTLVDCADPDCSPSATCVAPVPAPWTGPYWLDSQPWDSPAPAVKSCGGAVRRYYVNPAGPAECSACECGTMAGSACAQAPFHCQLGGLNCNQAFDYGKEFVQNCVDFDAPINGDVSCITGPTVPVLGSCTPSGGDFPNNKPFQQVSDLCPVSQAGTGCPQTHTCAPRPPADRASALCIAGPAGAPCPPGWSVALDAFGDGVDQRSCSPCVCLPEDGTGQCTQDVYSLAQEAGCLDFGPSPTFGGGDCVSYDLPFAFGKTWSFLRDPGTLIAEGTCMASGGLPMGSVVTQDPERICCTPTD